MQGKAIKAIRKRASTPQYVSPNQLILSGFETPFAQSLTTENRWVKMSQAIPWDKIVKPYDNMFGSTEGRPPISGRVIIGAMIIKHIEDFTDRETIIHIQENMFMQYFLGYSSFTNEAPFSAALFVEIRKRLSLEILAHINEVIVLHCIKNEEEDTEDKQRPPDENTIPLSAHTNEIKQFSTENVIPTLHISEVKPAVENKGKLITDATVAPQNITYPTDLKLLNAARVMSEELIDKIYHSKLHGSPKPRTYRQLARKDFLNTAKKKGKTQKIIYKANGSQLRYLKRNLGHIESMLACYDKFPLRPRDQKYLMVLHTVYEQQEQMHRTNTKRIEDRIVNIHQPYVRPIVRGKDAAKVEFGSKLQVSMVAGFTFIDHLSWDAFNESQYLSKTIENYKNRFGFYPAEVLADQIYCTRDNRKLLKEKGIKLMAKPLGRPAAKAVAVHLSPGERNPIEGKFGQAKLAYGLDNIKAKLKETSESWIACIALVLNLVRMTRQALVSQIFKMIREINFIKGNYKILKIQNLKNEVLLSL
jgi:transposase, IS5 family